MGVERGFSVGRRRRGLGRAVVVFAAASVLLATGCGQGAGTDREKAADVGEMDALLGVELTAIDAYERAIPHLRGEALAVARVLRGQGYAHVDAINKAVRGLGGEVDAEAAEPDEPAPRDRRTALLSLYEAESSGLAQALDAVADLELGAPRTLGAALAGSHAQHLATLRQLLGVPLPDAAPYPFENGEEPPPPAADGPEADAYRRESARRPAERG